MKKIREMHYFIIPKSKETLASLEEFSDYCDKKRLEGLNCFWCRDLEEANFLSGNHQVSGHETKIIDLN